MVGTYIVKSLKIFNVDPVLTPEQRAALKGKLIVTDYLVVCRDNVFPFQISPFFHSVVLILPVFTGFYWIPQKYFDSCINFSHVTILFVALLKL